MSHLRRAAPGPPAHPAPGRWPPVPCGIPPPRPARRRCRRPTTTRGTGTRRSGPDPDTIPASAPASTPARSVRRRPGSRLSDAGCRSLPSSGARVAGSPEARAASTGSGSSSGGGRLAVVRLAQPVDLGEHGRAWTGRRRRTPVPSGTCSWPARSPVLRRGRCPAPCRRAGRTARRCPAGRPVRAGRGAAPRAPTTS